MNKSNAIKLFLALSLIAVVVAATISYGGTQRSKQAKTDPTRSSLPTISEAPKQQEPAKDNENPSKPADSQPKPVSDEPSPAVATPSQPSSPQAPILAQIPKSSTPATGPADTLIPALVLGLLTGLYLVSRHTLRASK